MKKICDMDCFHCKHDDCVRDYLPKRPYKDWPQAWKDTRNKHRREKYRLHKEAGLCVECGKKRANRGVFCDECFLKRKRAGGDIREIDSREH